MAVRELKRTIRAFVFLKVDLGKEEKVMAELLELPEVEEVHEIAGQKDVLAVMEIKRDIVVPDMRTVADFVTDKIARIQAIRDTETVIPIRSVVRV